MEQAVAIDDASVESATTDLAGHSRALRMMPPGLTLVALTALTAAIHARDPHRERSWGWCAFHAGTGLYCPVCGGLRAVNDLTHGQVVAAISSNLLVTMLVPLVVVALARWTSDRWHGGRQRTAAPHPAWLNTIAWVALISFAVVRNLPFGAWLAP